MAPGLVNTPPATTNAGAVTKIDGVEYVDGFRITKTKVREEPAVITISDEELKSGVTKLDTILDAITFYHRDGCVVLENAIPDEIVDKLWEKMAADNEVYLNSEKARWIQGPETKNLSQRPPVTQEYFFREIYANVHTLAVLENLLGPEPEIRFVSSNVVVQNGTGRQAVHADASHVMLNYPWGIVVNIYLQDTTPTNGATELWLGTHTQSPKDQFINPDSAWIKESYMNERAKVKPPFQPTLRKGSICIRDLRLWHAGMPNKSDKPRIMLGIDYFAKWYQCPMKLRLPGNLKGTVESWGISTKGIKWMGEDFDYLKQNFFLNMSQDPSAYKVQTPQGTQDKKARETGIYTYDSKPTSHNWWTPPTPTTA